MLVSGGRGVGSTAGFVMLGRLAETLNAEVSSSRAMVDAGVMPHERQVGQTGKTVRPDLYFALGISGAIQHLAGMEEQNTSLLSIKTNMLRSSMQQIWGLLEMYIKLSPY